MFAANRSSTILIPAAECQVLHPDKRGRSRAPDEGKIHRFWRAPSLSANLECDTPAKSSAQPSRPRQIFPRGHQAAWRMQRERQRTDRRTQDQPGFFAVPNGCHSVKHHLASPSRSKNGNSRPMRDRSHPDHIEKYAQSRWLRPTPRQVNLHACAHSSIGSAGATWRCAWGDRL